MKNSDRQISISTKSMVIMGATVFAASFCGFLFSNFVFNSSTQLTESQTPFVLKADSAARGKQMSMATGVIDEGVEGVFVLDHLSGRLQCWVMNRRTGAIGGVYEGSAAAALGGEKGGSMDYVMTTGQINFQGARGNNRPASCICYVGDGNSGKVVGFSFRFNGQALAKGNTDSGKLTVICKGVIRNTAATRDQE